MMTRNSGSILVELIIATAISAMLSIMLFNALGQFNRGIFMTNDIIGRDDRVMLFFKQFERDVSGVFVPNIAKKEETPALPQSPAGKQTPETQGQQPQSATPVKKIKIEPLEDAFYSEMGEKQLKLLSFVTNNPMITYAAKPRLARVIYSLEVEADKKNSYRLMREESPDIFFKPQEQKKSSQKFMLIDGIKELSLEFVTTVTQAVEGEKNAQQTPAPQPGKQAPGVQKSANPEPQKKEITVKEWPSKELDAKGSARVPDLVMVRLVIWDNRYKREFVITYRIPIFATSIEEEPAKSSTQPPPLPTNNKDKNSNSPDQIRKIEGQGGQNNATIVKTGGRQ